MSNDMINNGSMEGKVCLITGANNGFGLVTAKEIAAKDAVVVLLCRDKTRGESAQAEILASTVKSTHLLLADLSLQANVECHAHL